MFQGLNPPPSLIRTRTMTKLLLIPITIGLLLTRPVSGTDNNTLWVIGIGLGLVIYEVTDRILDRLEPKPEVLFISVEKSDESNLSIEYQYKRKTEDGVRIKHGWYNEYGPDGEHLLNGRYKDGLRDGKWIYFDINGDVEDEDIYKDGVCVEMCEGDE